MYVNSRVSGRFERATWARMLGISEQDIEKFPREGTPDGVTGGAELLCAQDACRLDVRGHKVAIVYAAHAVEQECAWADLVIAQYPVRVPQFLCKGVRVLDRAQGWYAGAQAIYLADEGIQISSVRDNIGLRPWTPFHDSVQRQEAKSAGR
jgi:hypothetical protein